MQKILLVITDELARAIDHARGNLARNPWIEHHLRDVHSVKQSAERLRIRFPERELRSYEYHHPWKDDE